MAQVCRPCLCCVARNSAIPASCIFSRLPPPPLPKGNWRRTITSKSWLPWLGSLPPASSFSARNTHRRQYVYRFLHADRGIATSLSSRCLHLWPWRESLSSQGTYQPPTVQIHMRTIRHGISISRSGPKFALHWHCVLFEEASTSS